MYITFSIQIAGSVLKERLRGIVFDRTAILFSERASNCTNVLYLANSPSIFFVHCESGLIQIVLDFFQILVGVHRVHGCEKHCDCLSFLRLSSWNQSALDDGVHVVSVHDVVDVLGEVIWQQYIVLQCRFNEKYLLNVLGWLGKT